MEYSKWWLSYAPNYTNRYENMIKSCKNEKEYKKIIKEKLIREQEYMCLRCARDLRKIDSKRIHMHHIDYTGGSPYENNDPSNLCIICAQCHDVIHFRHRVGKAYKMFGNPFEKWMIQVEMEFLKRSLIVEKYEKFESVEKSIPFTADGQNEYWVHVKIEKEEKKHRCCD